MPSSWLWTSFTDQRNVSGEVLPAPSFGGSSATDQVGWPSEAMSPVEGTLSGTEEQDQSSITALAIFIASLAVSEAQDQAEISALPLFIGAMAANEAVEDNASFSGTTRVSGSLDAAEESDAVSAVAVSSVSCSLSASESADVASVAAKPIFAGSLAANEGVEDSATLAGASSSAAVLGVTEGQDSAAMAGVPSISGVLTGAEAQDQAQFGTGGVPASELPIPVLWGGSYRPVPNNESRPDRIDAVLAADEAQDRLAFVAETFEPRAIEAFLAVVATQAIEVSLELVDAIDSVAFEAATAVSVRLVIAESQDQASIRVRSGEKQSSPSAQHCCSYDEEFLMLLAA